MAPTVNGFCGLEDRFMARKVQIILIDDLDGDKAEETISFALDGSSYEIDLSSANAARLRDSLAPFVEAARRVPARGRRTARGASRPALSRERSAEIRAWARAQGKEINERGRIPQAILDEYRAVHG